MRDVFISHVEEDEGIALAIARGLQQAGYRTWCYEQDSVPGPSYLLQTGRAIEECRAVVLIISPESLGSNQVTVEVEHAHESRKAFIPVLRGITHAEFQARQPLWRQAVGTAASIRIGPEAVDAIVPRIVAGLQNLGIQPGEQVASEPVRHAPPPSEATMATPPNRPPGSLWQNRRLWAAAAGVALVAVVLLVLRLSRPMTPTEAVHPSPSAAQPTAAQVAAGPTAAPTLTRTSPTTAPGPTAVLPGGTAVSLQVTQVARQDYGAYALAFSPDGTLLYLAGWPMRTYDVRAQTAAQEVQIAMGDRPAFSADRTRLALPGSDGVAIWDLAAWSPVKTVQGIKDSRAVAFSPDNALLYARTGETVKVWDVATGQELRTIPAGRIGSIALSPDGRTLAIAGISEITLVDSTTGQKIRTLTGASGDLSSLVFSPDGTLLAVGGLGVGAVKVWDVASGLEKRTLRPPADAGALAFSADGRMLAAGCRLYIEIWDTASGKELASLTGLSSEVKAVTFSPDGTLLAATSDNELRLYQLTAGASAAATVASTGPMTAPTPAATGPSTAPTAGPGVNAVEAQQYALYGSPANLLAWRPDGKQILVYGANALHLYDVQARKEAGQFQFSSSGDGHLALASNGTLLASTWFGVDLWDVSTQSHLATLEGSNDSDDVAFSPDGKTLASVTGGTVKLWEMPGGRELRTIPSGRGHTVAFSPDGKTVAAESDNAAIKLWDATTGHELRTLTGHSIEVTAVDFSPDGRLLASASRDKTVRIWDVPTGRTLRTLTGHTSDVYAVDFAPDGRLVASLSWDLTVRLWDVASGKELASLTGLTGQPRTLAFSPDGTMVAAGSYDGMRVWSLTEAKP